MQKHVDHSGTDSVVSSAELKKLVVIFALWRGLLFGIGAIAGFFLKYSPSFPYADVILVPSKLPQWLYSWANFDGVHYITIAEKGYLGTGLIQAFFPFLPAILMRSMYLLSGTHINILATGLLITNVAALGALILWYVFLKGLVGSTKAWLGVMLLLLFPTSLFLGALYTESLFFLVVIAIWIAARNKQWLLVGVLTAIATSTRIVGVFLLPALLIELWLQWRSNQTDTELRTSITQQLQHFISQNAKQLLYVSIGMIGLLGYMLYLWKTFSDPLYFLHVQSEFGAGRTEGFVIYPQVVWRALRILLTLNPTTLRYYSSVLEFVAGTFGLIGLLYAALKVRLSYIIFALGAFFMPTFTGTFSSMPRYILVCFPLYLVLIELLSTRPRLRAVVLVGCGIVVIVNTILFIQGYWLS